jgi:hypothetical protein
MARPLWLEFRLVSQVQVLAHDEVLRVLPITGNRAVAFLADGSTYIIEYSDDGELTARLSPDMLSS